MTPWQIIILILMTLVFVAWAFEMFRALFGIARRSEEKLRETGGGYFRWMGHSFSSYGEFLTSPKARPQRLRLIALTVLLFAIIIGQVLYYGTTPSTP